jgi:Tfp pilus assembly protein PilZ
MRKVVHFNVLLSNDESMDEKKLERTVMINISKGGCFLFSGRDWSDTSKAWLIINELTDKTPIEGDIRWSVEWGKQMTIPGIGLSFKHIKSSQLEELVHKCTL